MRPSTLERTVFFHRKRSLGTVEQTQENYFRVNLSLLGPTRSREFIPFVVFPGVSTDEGTSRGDKKLLDSDCSYLVDPSE